MTIFDVLNEIELGKHPWSELSDDMKKAYNQFMINRFISSKKQYLQLLADITTMKLTDEQHYSLLKYAIARQKHYFDYKAYKNAKTIDDETLKAISREFKVSKRDAMRYIHQLSVTVIKQIVDKWHDFYVNYK